MRALGIRLMWFRVWDFKRVWGIMETQRIKKNLDNEKKAPKP